MDLQKIVTNQKLNWKNQIALRAGSYSLIITVIVLAILIVVNVFASALPTTLTKLDISSTKLYSITSNTKVVVNALEKDVTIYWIVQSGEEDEVIENLLGKYENLSEHIEIVKKNPDVYPTFTEKYTSDTVENNSLIVESGEQNRYIAYSDIYLTETDSYSYESTTSFDGEGLLTSAIDYVVSEELPQLYVVEGHGETELPETFSNQIEKENIEVNTLSLLTVEEVPEEADCVLIYGPQSDISEAEKDVLSEYVTNGGKLMVMAGPIEEGELTNLYSVIGEYGVEAEEGIVIEGDQDYYLYGYPYILIPDMSSHAITDSLIEEKYTPIFTISQGLNVSENTGNGTVTELLTTSDSAFSKVAGYNLETYEKEDGDKDGPFTLAVAIEDNSGGQIIWFASSEFMGDESNSYSSGANINLGANALSSLIGETEAVSIRSKSLDYNYLTISETTSQILKILMIGVFPLAYLGVGIIVVMRRRRVQNESI